MRGYSTLPDQMDISRSERELGGTGQPGKETNGFGDSVMNRLVSLLYKYKKTNTNRHKNNTQLAKGTTTNQSVHRTHNVIQVGDFGWGPGFPSDDPEHRCAFHYYGDYRGIYFGFYFYFHVKFYLS